MNYGQNMVVQFEAHLDEMVNRGARWWENLQCCVFNVCNCCNLALFLGIVNNNKGQLMQTTKNKVYYVPFNFFWKLHWKCLLKRSAIFSFKIYVMVRWMNGTTSMPKSIRRCLLDKESNFFSGILSFLVNFQDFHK